MSIVNKNILEKSMSHDICIGALRFNTISCCIIVIQCAIVKNVIVENVDN